MKLKWHFYFHETRVIRRNVIPLSRARAVFGSTSQNWRCWKVLGAGSPGSKRRATVRACVCLHAARPTAPLSALCSLLLCQIQYSIFRSPSLLNDPNGPWYITHRLILNFFFNCPKNLLAYLCLYTQLKRFSRSSWNIPYFKGQLQIWNHPIQHLRSLNMYFA